MAGMQQKNVFLTIETHREKISSIKLKEVVYCCLLKGYISGNTKVSQDFSFQETEQSLQSNTAAFIVPLSFKKAQFLPPSCYM